MNDLLEQYEKELTECLEKFDVKELDNFMDKWYEQHVIGGSVYANWIMTSRIIKKATMCKMIVHKENLSKKTKEKAKKWLRQNHFSQVL